MSARLLEYIANQQCMATRLVGVLEALQVLDNENVAQSAQSLLIEVAYGMADELNRALDSVSLPD
ncbi:hypothetical protein [Paracoccus aminophilus]|uniref:Uncharacterized protein n=1 Tax=Paracoccus aminophilus JCM 7686 TaxID=1367847 RepID=S5YSE0_PARAH|nr:hypothetical protein [Paracoccus aminophilus]AGT08131.1 hypothetical protein JCM7686_1022 [Paracoccus aminophilus JCM 7686]